MPPPHRPARADLPDLSTCACFNVRKAARAVTQRYDDALRPAGLRATQFSLLAVVHMTGGGSIGRLADEAVMDRTTLTRNLQLLEADGLIAVAAGDDARVREVALTAAGRAKLAAALPRWAAAQRQMAEAMGTGKFERLLEDLASAVAAGQASSTSGGSS